MASLHALLPEPAKPAYTPTLRPAQPFFPPAHRPAAAPATPFFPPAPKPAAPAAAPALLASVPPALAPAVAALAHAAQQQAPYQLLAHTLGHDPLTGRPAPAAPLALARTLVRLLPDGEARFQQLQAAGPALAQLPAWLAQQLAAHQLSGPRLTQVLAQTWTQLRALGLRDALDPAAALARLTQPWLHLGRDVARFVIRTERALLRWLVAAVLGPEQAAPVLKALDQGGDLLLRILRHPLPFLTNLVAAGKRGFYAFLANGPRHLRAAVQDWLLGGLAQAGLLLPARLDLAGLLDVLLQVFDLTRAAVLRRLRLRLPTLPTERLQEVLTQVGGVALTLWQHGPQAAWLAISQQVGDLRTQALDFVQAQVLGVAARAVPLFLASLAVPGGAFVQLARGLYNGVMLFVEKGKQLAQVGQALFASASAIAAGQLTPAATAVENTLVKMLPMALSFLAKQLGLDGISGAIQTGLKKVQAPVEKAVNKVLDTVAQKANALWNTLQTGASNVVEQGKHAVETTKNWLRPQRAFQVGPETHHVFVAPLAGRQTLQVASAPLAYEVFLARLAKGKLQDQSVRLPATAAVQQAQALAAQLARQIRGLLPQPQQLPARPGQAPQPTAAALELDRLLGRLADVTLHLMSAAYAGTQVRQNAAPAYSGVTAAGFGRGMHLSYLTSGVYGIPLRDVGELISTGSVPNPPTNAHYEALAQRGTGNDSYYVKGHLLNHHLHGTGTDWQNLTPLSRRGNSNHLHQIEAFVKQAAQDSAHQGQAAGQAQATRAFFYSVVPRYGRPVRESLLRPLRQGTLDAATLRLPAEALTRLITAEQYVPLSLTCAVREVSAADGQPVPQGLSLNLTVDNPVEQASLADYQPNPQVTGAPKNQPIFINSLIDNNSLINLMVPARQVEQIGLAVNIRNIRFYSSVQIGNYLIQIAMISQKPEIIQEAEAMEALFKQLRKDGKITYGVEK